MHNIVYEVCLEVKNFFVGTSDIHDGTFTIADGTISNSGFLAENQYFRIKGSVFNDGVYKNTSEEITQLVPETFVGQIWAMKPPAAFIEDCKAIEDWLDKYGGVDSASMSPYTSESFGGYSYSKGSGTSADGYGSAGFQSVFADKLRKWRRINSV